MLPGGAGCRNVASILLTVVLLVGCVGPVIGLASAGGLDGGPSVSSTEPASGTDVVHPDLRGADGEVTVVVRFPELDDERARANAESAVGTEKRRHAADSQAAFDEFVDGHAGVSVARSFWAANAKLVTVDTGAVGLGDLAAVDGVREIHPNYRMEADAATATATPPPTTDGTTDGPASSGQGDRTTAGLERIRAPEVWDRFGTRGEGVSVAVLDSGVNPDHPDVDLAADHWAEFDDSGDRVNSTPYASDDHGTHTSGTVAGGNTSGTYIGVAPDATLYHGKVLHDGTGTWAAATAGIEWAATEAEVDVVSMSLGGDDRASLVEPIQTATSMGTVVVASSGNDGAGTSGSPGNLYDAIAVGAVDDSGEVTGFSGGEVVDTAETWGSAAPDDWPDEYVVPNVVAPGKGVVSADPDGGYRTMSGTSMAAPHVAGTVALVQAASDEDLTQAEMRDLLERTAAHPAGDPEGLDARYGAGVIDAYRATVHGASDSTLGGRVVDASGTPVAGATVDTEFGYGTATDENGSYGLDVPSLAQTLTVDAFGFDQQTFTVAPEAGTHQRDLALTEPTLAARNESTPSVRIEPGETATYEFAVSNVTAVTVDGLGGTGETGGTDGRVGNDETAVERDDVTLRVDGETVDVGERQAFDHPRTNAVVTVEVETTDDAVGLLDPEFTFDDGTTAITRSPPRSHVHPDPLRVPIDYDPVDLQTAVDVAAPNATLVIDERSSGPYVLAGAETAATPVQSTSGLSISRPLIVRAADGASPEFAVADGDASESPAVGIDVAASGVELRGIDLDGGESAVGVRTADGTTIADATVSNASTAFEFRGDARARNVSIDGDPHLDVDATNVSLESADEAMTVPDRYERIGPAVDVESIGSDPSATLSILLADADATRLRNGTIGLWRFEGADAGWTAVERSGVDSATSRIGGTLDGFGTVAAMGERLPAEFAVDSVETGDVADDGEMTVAAEVANEGARTGTQDVDLLVEGDVVATEAVSLDAGESRRVELSTDVDVPTDPDDETLDVAVASEDAAASTSVDLARISGTLRGTVTRGTTGDRVDGATVTVTDAETGETVSATADASGEYGLRLPAGNYSVVTAADGYEATERPALRVAVGTQSTVDASIDRAPLFFDVRGVVTPPSATVGDAFEVTATVANLGHAAGTQSVELRVDDRSAGEETVRLEAGAERRVTFTHAGDTDGRIAVAVASDDARATGSVELQAEASGGGNSGGSSGGGSDDGASSGSGSGNGGDGGGSSTGGGGGSGGGSSAAPAQPAPSAPPADEETPEEADDGGNESDAALDVVAESVKIADSDPQRPGVSVPLATGSISEITFTGEDAAGSVTVREGVGDGLAAPPGTTLTQLAIEVPAALTDRPATITSTVAADAVGDGDLTMYRHADGEWQPLETTAEVTDDGVVVTAETPGFSRFALVRGDAASPAATPESGAVETPTSTGTATPSATHGSTPAATASPTTDDGAGFGVGVALVALLGCLLAARRAAR